MRSYFAMRARLIGDHAEGQPDIQSGRDLVGGATRRDEVATSISSCELSCTLA